MFRRQLAAALMASALAVPAMAAPAATPDGTLKIVPIDMEGGGGTLFVTPEGKSLLIDTGWPSNFGLLASPDGAKNSADRIVAAAKKLGVTKLDYVIITHFHMITRAAWSTWPSAFPSAPSLITVPMLSMTSCRPTSRWASRTGCIRPI
ncbi:MAG TPA: MBL fold metallo-hydrolase [Rhizomicrobium sp.]|nr:MBL fold metallo-hydrolase [Rhizomicrobium sp.]